MLENGHPFSREIGLSGKWSLCYMVRLLATPMVYIYIFVTFWVCFYYLILIFSILHVLG